MISYQKFFDISQAGDLPTLERRLIDFANDMGFGLVGAIAVTDHADRESDYVMLNNAPKGFAEATRNVPDSQRDPVLQKLKNTSIPFIYDQSLYVNSGAADLWEEQSAFGYKTGIAVALHLPQGKHFMLGFDRADPLPSNDQTLTWMLANLQLMAVHAQDAALRLLVPRQSLSDFPYLTPRELEILKWTYARKTAWEVSQILSISQWTVNFHMRSILSKIGVHSKREAVAKALACGVLG